MGCCRDKANRKTGVEKMCDEVKEEGIAEKEPAGRRDRRSCNQCTPLMSDSPVWRQHISGLEVSPQLAGM